MITGNNDVSIYGHPRYWSKCMVRIEMRVCHRVIRVHDSQILGNNCRNVDSSIGSMILSLHHCLMEYHIKTKCPIQVASNFFILFHSWIIYNGKLFKLVPSTHDFMLLTLSHLILKRVLFAHALFSYLFNLSASVNILFFTLFYTYPCSFCLWCLIG